VFISKRILAQIMLKNYIKCRFFQFVLLYPQKYIYLCPCYRGKTEAVVRLEVLQSAKQTSMSSYCFLGDTGIFRLLFGYLLVSIFRTIYCLTSIIYHFDYSKEIVFFQSLFVVDEDSLILVNPV